MFSLSPPRARGTRCVPSQRIIQTSKGAKRIPTIDARKHDAEAGPAERAGALEGYLRKVFVFVLAGSLTLNALLFISAILLVPLEQREGFFAWGGFQQIVCWFRGDFGPDSLSVMLPALHALQAHPHQSPYQSVFFDQHVKFVYPLTSLLPFSLMAWLGCSEQTMSWIIKFLCECATPATILVSGLMATSLVRRRAGRQLTRREQSYIWGTVLLGGIFFAPLSRAVQLGQMQAILNFEFALAFYCWIAGRQRCAGALIGLMTAVKPHYGIALIWLALRKKTGALVAFFVCLLAAAIPSAALYGLRANLDYLRVLSYISRHGESFQANQTMNGLLTRLLFLGQNMKWDPHQYALFHPVVYFGTTLTALALIGLGLFYRWPKHARGGEADFAAFFLALTAASVVAWEHHYGILYPILIWLVFHKSASAYTPKRKRLLAAAYLVTGFGLNFVILFANVPVLNILQSYLYVGALGVLALLFTDQPGQESATAAAGAS